RAEDVNSFHRLENIQLDMGLFHKAANLAWQHNAVHRGSIHSPGTLAWCSKFLNLKRLGNEKPDYQTMGLCFTQVLQANILTYWEVETGKSLREFADSKP
ncbi:hypothetical protein CONPUDRAFT_38235, partial [Coniophora puteana RWD-64-598 SS2]